MQIRRRMDHGNECVDYIVCQGLSKGSDGLHISCFDLAFRVKDGLC